MNKFFIVTILLFSGLAHAGNAVNNGGDALPDDQVSATELIKTINQTRQHLFLFLNRVNHPYYTSFKNVFETPSSIYDVLYNTEIEIKTNGACTDQDGAPSDATSQGSTPNSICMSAERLQKKLGVDNYRRQIWALALHEFSHRIGFDEAEALFVQKESLKVLRSINDNVLPSPGVLANLRHYFADDEIVLRYIHDRFTYLSFAEIVHITYVNFSPLAGGYSNTLFSEKEAAKLRQQDYRMRYAFVTGMCSIPNISQEGENTCRKIGVTSDKIQSYRDLFKNSSAIDVKAYCNEFDLGYCVSSNESVPITFIQSRQDGKKEIDTIYNDQLFIKKRYEFLKDVLN